MIFEVTGGHGVLLEFVTREEKDLSTIEVSEALQTFS